MRSFQKTLILLGKIGVLILIILLLSSIILWNMFFVGSKQPKLEKILEKDFVTLQFVGENLLSCDYEYVRWDDYNEDKISYGYTENDNLVTLKVDITDAKLKENIEILNENNCSTIRKTDNYVEFVYWNSIGSSVSLIYSPNSEPQIKKTEYDVVFEIKETKKGNWYYHKILGEL